MTKDEVKNELIRSLQGMDVSENEELDERAEKVTIDKEAIPVVQDYEKLVRSKKKGILSVTFRKIP